MPHMGLFPGSFALDSIINIYIWIVLLVLSVCLY